jgi:glutamyl-tRNA reductase
MKLVLLGLNHKTAPVALRERLTIPPERLGAAMRSLVLRPGVREGIIVSTCNRVEVLACEEPDAAAADQRDLMHFLHEYFSISAAEIEPHIYEYRERDAVRHLFRVASSLDSMVVGEPQILGQVKESYNIGREVGAVHSELDGLLQRAFTVAKKVRTETQIGDNTVSIASVAVDLALKIFGSLEGKCVLLVGAGKMGEQAARHLLHHGAASLMVTNRTYERAALLAAEYDCEAVPFEQMYSVADRADIVITSTGSPEPLILREHGLRWMHQRKGRPMFFIDIAVPRDVDPAMNKLDGIFVYDMDDLQSVAAGNMAQRSQEAEQAEQIVAEEVERFHQRLQTLDAVPAILALQTSLEEMRQSELQRAHSKLVGLNEEQLAAVDALTRGLVNKFLHAPLQGLKTAAREGDLRAMETALRMLLHNSKKHKKKELKD